MVLSLLVDAAKGKKRSGDRNDNEEDCLLRIRDDRKRSKAILLGQFLNEYEEESQMKFVVGNRYFSEDNYEMVVYNRFDSKGIVRVAVGFGNPANYKILKDRRDCECIAAKGHTFTADH